MVVAVPEKLETQTQTVTVEMVVLGQETVLLTLVAVAVATKVQAAQVVAETATKQFSLPVMDSRVQPTQVAAAGGGYNGIGASGGSGIAIFKYKFQ